MFLLFFFKFLQSTSFQNLVKLSFDDLKSSESFLIYIYYDKPGEECKACLDFNEKVATIKSFPIKTVNFYAQPYLASHLLEFVFPSFVLREKQKSFPLEISSFNDLLNLLDSGDWRKKGPKKWWLDVNSPFIKLLAFPAFLFFYVMDKWAILIDNTPSFVITFIICFIIAYLVVSIVGVFREDLTKLKKD